MYICGPTYMRNVCMNFMVHVIKDNNYIMSFKHANVKGNFWYVNTSSIYIVNE
jgi:hypothetical protein